MQVIKNEQVFRIGWRYENPNLQRILDAFDLSNEQALEITEEKVSDNTRPGKERRAGIPALVSYFEEIIKMETDDERRKQLNRILEKIRMKGWPRPTVTKCLLYNEENDVINYGIVKKFPTDPHDREKARKESMSKMLRDEWPGTDNKSTRTEFWNVYFSRNNQKIIKPTNGVHHNDDNFVEVKTSEFVIH